MGVLNFPDLDWRFMSGDLHTIPVGVGPDGQPRVVMDILLFDSMTAEESIAHTKTTIDKDMGGEGWDVGFNAFVNKIVPLLRANAKDHPTALAG
jgi:hypothetical protein